VIPSERIAVVGLGYVGLPVALAFARRFADTVGFDVCEQRVQALQANRDWTGEVTEDDLEQRHYRDLGQQQRQSDVPVQSRAPGAIHRCGLEE